LVGRTETIQFSALLLAFFPLQLSISPLPTTGCLQGLGKQQKKLFFSGPATNALLPPPFELSGHIFLVDIFSDFKKSLFFLSVQALTKKELFCGIPYHLPVKSSVANYTAKCKRNKYAIF